LINVSPDPDRTRACIRPPEELADRLFVVRVQRALAVLDRVATELCELVEEEHPAGREGSRMYPEAATALVLSVRLSPKA
jgi:hypothetical protein